MGEIRKEKEVKKKEEIIIGFKCDNCGMEISTSKLPKNWFSFYSRHFDWGNDSIDSYENHYICSPKCYFEKIKEKIEEEEGSNTFEINDMHIDFAKSLVEYLQGLINK